MWESPTNIVFLLQAGKTKNKEIEYLKNVINKIDLNKYIEVCTLKTEFSISSHRIYI